jgi:hypothetical protein
MHRAGLVSEYEKSRAALAVVEAQLAELLDAKARGKVRDVVSKVAPLEQQSLALSHEVHHHERILLDFDRLLFREI